MHIEKTNTYLGVFGILMVGTVLTVAAAMIDIKAAGGIFNDIIALAIAFTKASFVVLIFMHVRHSSKLVKLLVVASLLWLVFLFSFPVADELTRTFFGVEGK